MARPPTKKSKPIDPELAGLEPRERLVACSRELFQTKPFDAVNIREIMEVAGVTQTTIYYFFQNKDGLFLAALLDLLQELDQEFNQALRASYFQAQLKALAGVFTRPPAPNLPQLFQDLQRRVDLNGQNTQQGITAQEARPAFLYVNQVWPKGLENIIKEARRSGELQSGQPAFLAHYLLTLLTTYPHSPFNANMRHNPEYSIDTLLDFINNSLKSNNIGAQI